MVGDKMKKTKNVLVISVIAFAIIAIDQLSKWLVTISVPYNESKEIIHNFFYITNAHNYGAAWSILWKEKVFIVAISLIALILVFVLLFREEYLNNFKTVYYGLLIGGIIGNLIDRIVLGYVIDFLDFTFFGYNYPIFNISDVFIVISILLICIECFIPKKYKIHKTNDNREVEVLDFGE